MKRVELDVGYGCKKDESQRENEKIITMFYLHKSQQLRERNVVV